MLCAFAPGLAQKRCAKGGVRRGGRAERAALYFAGRASAILRRQGRARQLPALPGLAGGPGFATRLLFFGTLLAKAVKNGFLPVNLKMM